ncbi:MAG TPA: phosphatidylglycerophosphatase A [Sutterella sp.]|nr:phosphatidylglycerophosphatase A [Sutterella sp.]
MLKKYRLRPKPLSAGFVFSKVSHFLATGFGAGLLKPAPGTWGSALGIALYAGCAFLSSKVLLWGITFAIFVIGVWACEVTGKDAGVHDHPSIVIDEVLGVWIAALFVPFEPIWLLAAFAVFRFFDIVKVWPAKYFDEKVTNGFGVMADDFVAGAYSAMVLYAALTFL